MINVADIASINRIATDWAAANESICPLSIRKIVIAEDALEDLSCLASDWVSDGRLLVCVDATPMSRSGQDIKHLLPQILSHCCSAQTHVLASDKGHFHAHLAAATELADKLRAFDVVLSIGSGSVTDVVKYARHLCAMEHAKDIPFICCPTAASVTAYTSGLAVLTVDGVKRTLPAKAPDAVICDLQILSEAPPMLSQAGFGDVLARSVSYGDWYLAWALGMDDHFSEIPMRLLDHAEQAMVGNASEIRERTMPAIRALTDAVLLAGMAMTLVNQTAPLSGWEHVISHYLDLSARRDQRQPALHGGQVGVATLLSARAYERFWSTFDVTALLDVTPISPSDLHDHVRTVFESHDHNGKLIAEIWGDVQRKAQRWCTAESSRVMFRRSYDQGHVTSFLNTHVRSSANIAQALGAAGAPMDFESLDQPVSQDSVLEALQNAHLVRARFTFGDLLAQCGWLTRSRARKLLAE